MEKVRNIRISWRVINFMLFTFILQHNDIKMPVEKRKVMRKKQSVMQI